MLTLLPKGVQTKWLKTFWLKIFVHLPPVSTTLVVHLELQISPRIFEKIWNCRNGILRCLGETDSWLSQKSHRKLHKVWFGHKHENLKYSRDLHKKKYLFVNWKIRPSLFSLVSTFKGTQDWEFFWLRFWNLHYFFVSYVKILRFYKKNFLIGPLLGEVRFFRVVLRLCGMKKNFELGPKIFFFFFNFGP